MDIRRVTSAILGFPIVLLGLIFGNELIIGIALSIIAIIAMQEYLKAVEHVCKPIKWIGYISCVIVACVAIIPNEWMNLIITTTIPVILLILFGHVIFSNMKTTLKDIAYTFLGIAYVVLFTMFLALIYGMENGKILIWYTLFAAWGTDLFAYAVGKLIGKHKFSSISPNKTIEGAVGGVIGAIIFVVIYTIIMNNIFLTDYSIIYVIIMTSILSLVGQIGDFSASSIKRHVGIKDFSDLIPGHGGILDRIDSLIFLAPVAYLLLTFI